MGLHIPLRINAVGTTWLGSNDHRANPRCFRDDCIASRVLAQSHNPLQGGSDSRISEITSKLQILQRFSVAGDGDGSQIRSEKDQAMCVGMLNPTNRVDSGKKEEKIKRDNLLLG